MASILKQNLIERKQQQGLERKSEKRRKRIKKMKYLVAMASRVKVEIKRHKNKVLPPPHFEIILRSRL